MRKMGAHEFEEESDDNLSFGVQELRHFDFNDQICPSMP